MPDDFSLDPGYIGSNVIAVGCRGKFNKEGQMKAIVLALVIMLVLPCYCYSASLDKGMEDVRYLYNGEEYDSRIAQDEQCRQVEALFIMGSVAIVYACIILADEDRCGLGLLSALMAFYVYYTECLPLEPEP